MRERVDSVGTIGIFHPIILNTGSGYLFLRISGVTKNKGSFSWSKFMIFEEN